LQIPHSTRGSPIQGAQCSQARPGDFAKLISDETRKWGNVILAANIKAR
jgi:hypothetical protein